MALTGANIAIFRYVKPEREKPNIEYSAPTDSAFLKSGNKVIIRTPNASIAKMNSSRPNISRT